ncbi:MAG: FAD-dependent oxidoreductase [Caldilineaceae bacterium]
MAETQVTIVGGGLAGTEAAWQLAETRIQGASFEMRPKRKTPAHITDRLAELVCSNSMGSTLPDRALGILKNEMLAMGSMIIRTAFKLRCLRARRLPWAARNSPTR